MLTYMYIYVYVFIFIYTYIRTSAHTHTSYTVRHRDVSDISQFFFAVNMRTYTYIYMYIHTNTYIHKYILTHTPHTHTHTHTTYTVRHRDVSDTSQEAFAVRSTDILRAVTFWPRAVLFFWWGGGQRCVWGDININLAVILLEQCVCVCVFQNVCVTCWLRSTRTGCIVQTGVCNGIPCQIHIYVMRIYIHVLYGASWVYSLGGHLQRYNLPHTHVCYIKMCVHICIYVYMYVRMYTFIYIFICKTIWLYSLGGRLPRHPLPHRKVK